MKEYYAIKAIDGKTINKILNNWTLCRGMVNKHSSVYRGFNTLEDAVNYLGSKNKIIFCGFSNKGIAPQSVIKHRSKKKPIPTFPKGERLVQRYLDSLGIVYNTQRDTLECINPKTGRVLPYDFELPKEKIIIEVNGIEHYKFIKCFHKSEEEFEYQKYRDRIKREFAVANGYKFVELKWTSKHSYSWVTEKLQDAGIGGTR